MTLPFWLRRGWPDRARLIAQQPTLVQVSRKYPLTGRCLNAGCGEGLYISFIDSFPGVTEIVNTDLAGTVERLKHLQLPRYLAVDASLTALPFPDASFDSCVCTEVLEHIPDHEAAVRELSRCLRPGGRLLVSVPHPPAPFDPNHVREGYTLAEMSALLNRHGFAVVESGQCLTLWMDILLRIWRWQHRVFGRGKQNFMPLIVVNVFGYADRVIPLGRRWDLVVMAVRR